MKILILKNIEREGPGLIADWLTSNQLDFDVLEVTEQLLYQDLLIQYDGLIILGGPSSANDKTFIIQQEIDFVKKWLKSGKPYLGVCLGMQLMVKATGGEVYQNKIKEIGFSHLDNQKQPYIVQLQDLESNPLSKVLPEEFQVFQLHGETVKHNSFKSLAKSKWCEYQICAVADNQLGVQFHFELTEEALKEWILRDDDLIFADKNAYLTAYETHKTAMKENCAALMKSVFG